MISYPSDITVSNIEFGPVKLLKSGGKTANINYESRPIRIETPSLNVPFGVNVFDKQGPPKFSVDLSLRGADDNTQIRALQDFLEAFDERMIDAGVENASKWFKMNEPDRVVIKAFYTPLVKVSRDTQNNPKPYPPTFKLAMRKKLDSVATSNLSGSFETHFYNAAEKDVKGDVVKFAPDMAVDQVLCKRAQVTAIIQCTGIWFAGGKFGTTWKAVQLRVDSQPEQIRGPAFRSEAPDIRAFVSKGLAAKAGAGSGSGYGGEDVEEDDDGEEEAEEVVAAVVPKKAAVVVAKPVVTAPAPATTFEEESVSEPVPVPKKVVKKVVSKAAPKA
jgi:hypothetical protein